MGTTTPNDATGRLNGWKEIAAHLGKGPRTAQRWEKDYGLPVHRIGRDAGEIVFAFRDEIDRWARAAAAERRENGDGGDAEASVPRVPLAQAGPAKRPPRRLAAVLWLALAAAGVAALAAVARCGWMGAAGTAAALGQPTSWRFANESLSVFDQSGRELFRHEFGFQVLPSSSTDSRNPRSSPVRIADIDGDGQPEILALVGALRRENHRFYCFGGDGRVRFVDEPHGRMRFGDQDYGEPWLAHRSFVTGTAAHRSLWAVFTHNLWFPARLRRLDPRGNLLSEYWSNGYVEFVEEVVWRGQPVVLVGGVGNDVHGGSLALFDGAAVRGHAPSYTPDHACHGCPGETPLERLTFPTMCLARRLGGLATVVEAWVDGGDRITVAVLQGSGDGEPGTDVLVHYTFRPDFSLSRAEISREFQAVHARLAKQGLLDHEFGKADEAEMFPVLRFGPDGPRPVAPVPVIR